MTPEQFKLMRQMAKAIEDLTNGYDVLASNVKEIFDLLENPLPVTSIKTKKFDVIMETTRDAMLDKMKQSQFELEFEKIIEKYGITSGKISF